jgi:phosphohistidine phosphatase
MQLLIVRHAIAEDRLIFSTSEQNDDLRPLTEKGRKRLRHAASGLHRLVPRIEVLATSPLVRAVQTAEILGRSYGCDSALEVPALAPDVGAKEVGNWLATQPHQATVAVVGHEPDLSQLIGWLTSGLSGTYLDLKKGGACLLECCAPLDAGGCRMQWLLTPRQLRMLGER